MATGRVVFHADDFGMNRAVSDGILQGFREGLLTSTAVLANAPDAHRALGEWNILVQECGAGQLPSASLRRALGDPPQPFDLGVHLNLTQGRPLLGDRYPAELLDRNGRFPGPMALFSRLKRRGGQCRAAILEELSAQVQVLRDHGLSATHLNGHHYVELMPGVSEVIPELLGRFGIRVVRVAAERSLVRSAILNGLAWRRWLLARLKQVYARRFHSQVERLAIHHPDTYYGTAHAGSIDMRAMRVFLDSPPSLRLVEIGMHPALAGPATADDAADGWHDPLSLQRAAELQLLLSDELAEQLRMRQRRLGRLGDLAAA